MYTQPQGGATQVKVREVLFSVLLVSVAAVVQSGNGLHPADEALLDSMAQ